MVSYQQIPSTPLLCPQMPLGGPQNNVFHIIFVDGKWPSHVVREPRKISMTITNGVRRRHQFHKHFSSSFFANILLPKNYQHKLTVYNTYLQYRKAAQNTLVKKCQVLFEWPLTRIWCKGDFVDFQLTTI